MANVVAAIPAAVVSPVKTARTNPYVVFAVIIALTIVLVVAIEARRPGAISNFVNRTLGRVPVIGPHVMNRAG